MMKFGGRGKAQEMIEVPSSLWAKLATIFLMCKISNRYCVNSKSNSYQDPNKPFKTPSHIYSISYKKESLQGKMLIIEDFRAPSLIIPCFRPSNLPILLVRKPKGQECRFDQDI